MKGAEALEGARRAINILREKGHKIVIHSSNELDWIVKTLNNLDIRYDKIVADKFLADLYVDDKGYHFPYNGNWNTELDKIFERVEGLDNRKW